MEDSRASERQRGDGLVAYSMKETAARSQLSRATLYNLINRGELETVKVAGRRLVPEASLRKLVGAA